MFCGGSFSFLSYCKWAFATFVGLLAALYMPAIRLFSFCRLIGYLLYACKWALATFAGLLAPFYMPANLLFPFAGLLAALYMPANLLFPFAGLLAMHLLILRLSEALGSCLNLANIVLLTSLLIKTTSPLPQIPFSPICRNTGTTFIPTNPNLLAIRQFQKDQGRTSSSITDPHQFLQNDRLAFGSHK
ncbi:hypothetical protein QA612_17505 [Evansella sp. AB-P1]|uniref:hypothetical protein n=1 Tax=Evansella sp. AB-P1 TaxID=3037653 RepID=UPI00241DB959|nr:hypothetical protein [Evansella sp. AB-P1]MDG5789259.1 hypothetical protein [Evansella sp. AB-P1]